MSSQKGPKVALEGNPGGGRRKGRLRKRWIDDVQDNVIKMGVKRWRTISVDRREWKRICEAVKVLQELYSHGGGGGGGGGVLSVLLVLCSLLAPRCVSCVFILLQVLILPLFSSM
jgi:hypothetical protein